MASSSIFEQSSRIEARRNLAQLYVHQIAEARSNEMPTWSVHRFRYQFNDRTASDFSAVEILEELKSLDPALNCYLEPDKIKCDLK